MKKSVIAAIMTIISLSTYSQVQNQTVTGNLQVDQNITAISDINVGEANVSGKMELGSKLVLGGNDHNTDPVWMAKYNVSANKTDLRINIGDDNAGDDRFVVGNIVWGSGGTWTDRFVVTNQSRVGIGISNPTCALDVNGDIKGKNLTTGNAEPHTLSKFVILGPNQPLTIDSKREISFEFNSAGKSIIRAYRGPAWGNFLQFLTTDNSGSTPYVRMHIHNNGDIGIGTENPKHKLDVSGTIRAKEVKIEVTGWADFVFDNNYRLSCLSEVEQHIKEHKHLPGIPSEQEVLENGINVAEMQAKLLQKIEELTLYVINQQKEIESLKEENIRMNNLLINSKK